MLNLYVTSANRKDGKTFLTAGIAATMQSLGYSTSVYKPVQTGGIEVNGFNLLYLSNIFEFFFFSGLSLLPFHLFIRGTLGEG